MTDTFTTYEQRDDTSISIGIGAKVVNFYDPLFETDKQIADRKARTAKAAEIKKAETARAQTEIDGIPKKQEDTIDEATVISPQCIISAKPLNGEIGPVEISDLIQYFMRHYPKEVKNALTMQLAVMARVGVFLKTA